MQIECTNFVRMIISLIAAIGEDRSIGKNNGLIWRLKDDMKLFRRITTGHTVIMGRKTFESIGRPLPNRRNIVISKHWKGGEGIEVFSDLDEGLQACQNAEEHEVFIIGGGEIYRQALPLADKLYLSKVSGSFPDADTWFPEVDWREWDRRELEQFNESEENSHAFEYSVYTRSIG